VGQLSWQAPLVIKVNVQEFILQPANRVNVKGQLNIGIGIMKIMLIFPGIFHAVAEDIARYAKNSRR